jgi:transcriptional regulator with XRE-family HTH domain
MIHRALKLTRQFHRLNQTELAAKLNISKSFLSELESGKKAPTLELLERYAQLFNMPASTLLLFSEKLGRSVPKRRILGADKVLRILEWVARGEDDRDAAA